MRILYHLPLDSHSRKIRLILGEKKLDFELKSEKVWERRDGFLRMNPAGEVPILIDEDGAIVPGHRVIAEFLEEQHPEVPLIGKTALDRAETRRLSEWFDDKFSREVTRLLVDEKLMKRFLGTGQPNSAAIRAGNSNIGYHLDYLCWLTERRNWLAGDDFSMADIAAAAQLSAVDYLGDVPWDQYQGARDWYARIKSRRSMRPLLKDLIPGASPPAHYANPDF